MTTLDLSHVRARRTRFLRRPPLPPGLMLAWLTLLLAALWALFPSLFTAYDPLTGTPGAQRLPPGAEHWLGTDQLGRDLYARLVWGASHTLSGALVAVALGLGAGTLYGVVAGAAGGRTEQWLMRLVDVLLAIPGLLLALCVIILLGFGTVNAAL
ncbi:ABC transporter permease, partial [Cronobacter sakazakii]